MGDPKRAALAPPASDTHAVPTEHSFDRIRAALLGRGARIVVKSPDRFRATCPAHSDRNPSLSVSRVDGKVLLRCFAGCATKQIVDLLGLKMADLFQGTMVRPRRREIEATYDYSDASGSAQLQKVRYSGKQFGWRRRDPARPGRFLSGIDGASPVLYRVQELSSATTVIIVEGEKAVDRLAALGLQSTCPPTGANCWKPEWSQSVLAGQASEVLVLADHDVPGAKHAERVAADLSAHLGAGQCSVKVVLLPGLPKGGDVVDYLDAGHSVQDLLAVAADTPCWEFGMADKARRQRRNEQAKMRMRRSRALRKGLALPQERQHDAEAAGALDAVIECLTVQGPCSGRAVWRQLKAGSFSRRAIDRALVSAVVSGIVEQDVAHRPGLSNVYRIVTSTGSAASGAPALPLHAPAPDRESAQRIEVFQCPVTPFAVTQVERTSVPLQNNVTPGSLQGVTPKWDSLRSLGKVECCDERGKWPRCKLCPSSHTYWRQPNHGKTGRER